MGSVSSQMLPGPGDIVLGTAEGPYCHPQFRLTPEHQTYHGLVWGSTGVGKSKILQSIFLQHLDKGQGVCLIDPHSDLSRACLAHLIGRGHFEGEEAYQNLIYIDFSDHSYVPFNVLKTPYDDHTTALNTLEALMRTWPDLKTAPLFKTLFLSSVMVLIANNLPLTAIYPLLLDEDFRERCLLRVGDPVVRQTFEFYGRGGGGQAGSTLRRAFLLSFSPVTRFCWGQRENWLNFRAIMDAGKSMILDLGSIADPVTRRLVGAMLMVQIEQAALSRTDIPRQARRPWTCLVDEWPAFAAAQGETIENVLSQARKFNLRLYLAAQSLAQVDSKRLGGALENCRLSIAFRLGRDSATLQARHIARIDPYKTKRTSGGSERYASTSEQYEQFAQELQNLPARMAYVRLHDRPPVRIRTLTIRQPELPEGAVQVVIDRYRQLYQRRRSAIEAQVFNPTVPGGEASEAAAEVEAAAHDHAPPQDGLSDVQAASGNTGRTDQQAGRVDYAHLFGEEVEDDG